ncbi:hypothetical protein D3C71_1034810 [compost metagenome]
MDFLTDEYRAAYDRFRQLPDGRWIGSHRLLMHWTIHVDLHEYGYEDRYCFATKALADAAFDNWDGTGDPEGWHRHPKTGRRRDLATGKEWIAW